MTFPAPFPHRVRADSRSDTPMPMTQFGESVNKALVRMCISPAIKFGDAWMLGGMTVNHVHMMEMFEAKIAESYVDEIDGKVKSRLTYRGKTHACKLLGREADSMYFQRRLKW